MGNARAIAPAATALPPGAPPPTSGHRRALALSLRLPPLALAAVGCGAFAAVSLAIVPAAPGYDAWSWLIWGRELLSLDLSTGEGPAFKPLPVAVCAPLAVFGEAAPTMWVWLARTGALVGIVLAAALARELSAGSRLAWATAAAGVAFAGGYVALAAAGGSEGLLVALALLAGLSARRGHPRAALLCGAACGLLRVETWPFLGVAAAVAWRRGAIRKRLLGPALALVPTLWFMPEWLASGDPLRSAGRALVPNGGQPALADLPALASVREAAALFLIPAAAGLPGLFMERPRRSNVLWLGAVGGGWIVLVSVMSQLGFSGEGRYSLPGVALLTIAGGVGLAEYGRRLRRPAARRGLATVLGSLMVLAVVPRGAALLSERSELAYRARLATDLRAA
ncbi:MAG: hypothetical protein M3131_11240, partial [Actinomycetota bacterium]|nr:hypothetical protein [Actinomycetota bacterium]